MTHAFLCGENGMNPACCLSICVLREAGREPWVPLLPGGAKQVLNGVLGQVLGAEWHAGPGV